MMSLLKVSDGLRQAFDTIEGFSSEYRDWGFIALPLSGRFCRDCSDVNGLVSAIKPLLPADVRIFSLDGMAIRAEYMRDEFVMVFASQSWPQVKEGEILPRMHMVLLRDGFGVSTYNIHTVAPLRCAILDIPVNKETHRMTVPKEFETEDRLLIRIEPIE